MDLADFIEFAKEAGSDYYQRNRSRILAKNKQYRAANKHKISLKGKRYRRQLKSGVKRQRSRQRVGQSYIYTGYK